MIRVGTSGFSYPGWKPRFYPASIPAAKLLDHYGARLCTVEINNTFYRRPEPKNLEHWAARVPDDFRFVFKASRYFSSGPGLREPERPLREFFGLLEGVGDKLGAVFVQVPDHVPRDVALLARFLAAIPNGRRVALELRHPSWRSDDVRALLGRAGAAWCLTESDDAPLEAELVASAPFAYVRLRKSRYGAKSLAALAERLSAANVTDGYVFFKHDELGVAARNAVALQKLLPL